MNSYEHQIHCKVCVLLYLMCAGKVPGDDCPLVWGQCSHCFHMHCILKWLNSQQVQQQCPMCRQEWKFKEWGSLSQTLVHFTLCLNATGAQSNTCSFLFSFRGETTWGDGINHYSVNCCFVYLWFTQTLKLILHNSILLPKCVHAHLDNQTCFRIFTIYSTLYRHTFV